jgi:hypothetical protein
MPFCVKVWVEDCEDGCYNVYVDNELITEQGAQALQLILNRSVTGWRRLDEDTLYATLQAVTG